MRTITSIEQMQRLAHRWRRAGRRIGFVPTMGYLHAGHLSLIREARRRVGRGGVVVVSIYVNPTQFAPHEDLAKYPRDLPRDRRLCREAGTDVLFLPADSAMYPGRDAGRYSTYVVEEVLSRGMEGASRPTHFRGVTTVVAKLFNIVQPDVAVFGAKDFQQAAIVSRMVANLNFPVRMVVAPTVREADGLALSSRNQYLNPEQRAQATALWESIRFAQDAVARCRAGVPVARLKRRVAALIATRPAARLDYVEVFDPATLRPVSRARRGDHLALAVFVGPTRLIDNARL
jgi:pantoate--beta-alanine ligase